MPDFAARVRTAGALSDEVRKNAVTNNRGPIMATREDGAATQGAGWTDVLRAVPEAWPIPREVAGVELPDSKLARDATEYVRKLSAPVVFNHVLRTYVFGALLGQAMNLKFDSELFYLGPCSTTSARPSGSWASSGSRWTGPTPRPSSSRTRAFRRSRSRSSGTRSRCTHQEGSSSASVRKSPWSAPEQERMLLASGLTSFPERRSRK